MKFQVFKKLVHISELL